MPQPVLSVIPGKYWKQQPDKIRFKGYAFQIEMKFTASTLKFRLQEVPIIFTDRTLGTSKMSKGIIKEAVFGVITMKMRALFGKIKPRKD